MDMTTNTKTVTARGTIGTASGSLTTRQELATVTRNAEYAEWTVNFRDSRHGGLAMGIHGEVLPGARGGYAAYAVSDAAGTEYLGTFPEWSAAVKAVVGKPPYGFTRLTID